MKQISKFRLTGLFMQKIWGLELWKKRAEEQLRCDIQQQC